MAKLLSGIATHTAPSFLGPPSGVVYNEVASNLLNHPHYMRQ